MALTHKQEVALYALLTSPTISDAARYAGVHPDSITRWRRSSEFRAAYDEMRRTALQESAAYLAVNTRHTLEILFQEAIDAASSTQRISAAKMFLRLAFQANAQQDLQSRVDDLTDQLAALQGAPPPEPIHYRDDALDALPEVRTADQQDYPPTAIS